MEAAKANDLGQCNPDATLAVGSARAHFRLSRAEIAALFRCASICPRCAGLSGWLRTRTSMSRSGSSAPTTWSDRAGS